jgi:hypothetical protein
METEIWVPVLNYEGLYEASNLGRIKLLEKRIKWGKSTKVIPTRILKPYINNHGYLYVTLYDKDRNKTNFGVHRIILSSFEGSSDLHACHLDFDRTNNKLDNLQFMTLSQNIERARLAGRVRNGESHGGSKLVGTDVKRIRKLYSSGVYTQKQLARKFNMGKTTIGDIVNLKTWKHI